MGWKEWLGQSGWTRRLGRRWQGPLIVLMYHDLAAPGDHSSWLRVPLARFEEQIRTLGEIGRFVSPQECWSGQAGEGEGLRLLLTFDDGFVNNYRLALPVLVRHRVPALFFVTTWHMETGEPFWFDRVVEPIQAAGVCQLDLRPLGLGAYRLPAAPAAKRWDAIQVVLEEIKRSRSDLEAVVREVERAAGLGCRKGEVRRRYRPLTRKEIQAMAVSGWCRFGSHSHRHEILTGLDDAALAQNLGESRTILEEVTGEAVDQVAYPNGDLDPRVAASCRAAGYRQGYLVRPGVVTGATEPLTIPRIAVGGYDSAATVLFKINRQLLRGRPAPGVWAERSGC